MKGNSVAKKAGIALGITVGSLLLILFGLVAYFSLIRVVDMGKQKKHMENLRLLYEKEAHLPVDEQQFVGFDLLDNNFRLNEIQLLATHNSYKKQGSSIAKKVFGRAGCRV